MLPQVAKVVMGGGRLEIPPDPAALPGGTFGGVDLFTALIRKCWAQDPAARPTFADIIADLK